MSSAFWSSTRNQKESDHEIQRQLKEEKQNAWAGVDANKEH